jgi:isochorismate pyruvate lyase
LKPGGASGMGASMVNDPKTCTDMASLRALIDELDQEIVDRLAMRARCIDQAVELKRRVGWPARIGPRVEEVAGRVRARASAQGLDPDLVERLWRDLMEWSIAREERSLGVVESADER